MLHEGNKEMQDAKFHGNSLVCP